MATVFIDSIHGLAIKSASVGASIQLVPPDGPGITSLKPYASGTEHRVVHWRQPSLIMRVLLVVEVFVGDIAKILLTHFYEVVIFLSECFIHFFYVWRDIL